MADLMKKVFPWCLWSLFLGLGAYAIIQTYSTPKEGIIGTPNPITYQAPLTTLNLTQETLPQQWTSPKCQSNDGLWQFELFTPPEITLKEDTRLFQAKPYFLNIRSKQCPFQIAGLNNQLYPLIFEGYYELSTENIELALFNQKTQEHLIVAYPGSSNNSFCIESFTPEHYCEQTNQCKAASITLYDSSLDQCLTLTPQTPAKTKAFCLTLHPVNTRENPVQLTKVGQTFSFLNKYYRLTAMDYDQSLAIFEDLSNDQTISPFITLSLKDIQEL